MKLSEVLSRVGSSANSAAASVAVIPVQEVVTPEVTESQESTEPAVQATTDESYGAYKDVGVRKTACTTFPCQRCNKLITPGTVYAWLKSDLPKTMRAYVHVGCIEVAKPQVAASESDIKRVAAELDRAVESSLKAVLAVETTKVASLKAELSQLNTLCELELRDVRKAIDKLKETQRVEIVIKTPDRDLLKLDSEFIHPAFQEVLDLVCDGEEVFLPGPTGCGKSHLVKQVAAAYSKFKGWESTRFASISCSGGVTESSFFGKLLPAPSAPAAIVERFASLVAAGMNEQTAATAMAADSGSFAFQSTQFLDVYENGGVFLLDEMDACDENVLVAINSALANGYVAVPNRVGKPVAYRHPDFVCVGAANTFGRGADRLYVGRTQLDESTLDRFRFGVVPMDYSEELEAKLCPSDTLRSRLQGYRAKMAAAKLERVCSTRFLGKAYKALARFEANGNKYGYPTVLDYIDSKLMSGWTEREIMAVRGSKLPVPAKAA